MKSFNKILRIGGLMLLLFGGIWLLSLTSGPSPETAERQQAIQAFAPADVGDRDAVGEIVEQSVSFPTTVNLGRHSSQVSTIPITNMIAGSAAK